MREDPELKELIENVVEIRRTRRGEKRFELMKDLRIKSSAFRELVAKSLGGEVNVTALLQNVVVMVKDQRRAEAVIGGAVQLNRTDDNTDGLETNAPRWRPKNK